MAHEVKNRWKRRTVRCLAIFLIAAITILCGAAAGGQTAEAKKKSYDKYSSSKHGWGLSLNNSHKVPVNGEAKGIEKKNAYYYVKTKKKRIYLSFDCGYENGYTSRILDVLKKNKIKAIFFVTKDYIRGNVKLVKRMKREGHLVGNHTMNHPSLPTCSVSRIKKEILGCASYMKKKTGYEMDKFIRPPMGEWSQRSLKVTQDIGYTTIFWSMAFYDYDTSNQPGKQAIFKQFMAHYHKGEIVLLHAISKSDTQALPSIIKAMKKKGYTFGELSELEE